MENGKRGRGLGVAPSREGEEARGGKFGDLFSGLENRRGQFIGFEFADGEGCVKMRLPGQV